MTENVKRPAAANGEAPGIDHQQIDPAPSALEKQAPSTDAVRAGRHTANDAVRAGRHTANDAVRAGRHPINDTVRAGRHTATSSPEVITAEAQLIQRIKRSELRPNQLEILEQDWARWQRLGSGAHLNEWLEFYPGLETRATTAITSYRGR
jgi:hypothetical protein